MNAALKGVLSCAAYLVMLFVLICLSLCAFSDMYSMDGLPSKSIKKHPETVLVLWGMRHGNRNPEQFLPLNDRNFGYEGEMELNKFGKLQSLGFGMELRKFVSENLIENYFVSSEAKFYSSSASRCQSTLQTTLAGLFTPTGIAEWEPNRFASWEPISYTIDDPLLRMYSVKDCPNSDKVWKPITDDTVESLAKMESDGKILLNYMSLKTGWKPKISNAADLADNIAQMKLYKTRIPDWLKQPQVEGYKTTESLLDAYLRFAEAHQIACAEDEECSRMMGGYWLKHIFDSIKTTSNQKKQGLKMIGYVSHTEITLSVMKLMGYTRKEIATSAGFVIEVKLQPEISLRFLEHDPNPIEKHVIYKASLTPELSKHQDVNGFIPLHKFEEFAGSRKIDDWEEACGREPCKDCGHRSSAVRF